MELTLDHLKRVIQHAIDGHYKFIGVAIETKGSPQREIIVNPKGNFETKLEYYSNAYNEDCTLKTFNGIRIVGATYGDCLAEIEKDLIDDDEE